MAMADELGIDASGLGKEIAAKRSALAAELASRSAAGDTGAGGSSSTAPMSYTDALVASGAANGVDQMVTHTYYACGSESTVYDGGTPMYDNYVDYMGEHFMNTNKLFDNHVDYLADNNRDSAVYQSYDKFNIIKDRGKSSQTAFNQMRDTQYVLSTVAGKSGYDTGFNIGLTAGLFGNDTFVPANGIESERYDAMYNMGTESGELLRDNVLNTARLGFLGAGLAASTVVRSGGAASLWQMTGGWGGVGNGVMNAFTNATAYSNFNPNASSAELATVMATSYVGGHITTALTNPTLDIALKSRLIGFFGVSAASSIVSDYTISQQTGKDMTWSTSFKRAAATGVLNTALASLNYSLYRMHNSGANSTWNIVNSRTSPWGYDFGVNALYGVPAVWGSYAIENNVINNDKAKYQWRR